MTKSISLLKMEEIIILLGEKKDPLKKKIDASMKQEREREPLEQCP